MHAGATPTKTLTRDDPREPEVLTQCPTGIFGPVHADFLKFGNHVVDEAVEAAGSDVRNEDETVTRVGLHEPVDLVGDGARRSDERLTPRDLDDQLTS